jgi:hypothetical protein
MQKESRRQRKYKIAQVYGKINERRLGITQLADLLQVRNQYPIDIVKESP